MCWSVRTSVLSPNSLKLRFVTFNQTLLIKDNLPKIIPFTFDHIKNQAVFLFLTQTLAVCLDYVNTLIPWKGDGTMMDSPVLLWLDCLAYRQEPMAKTAAHLSGRLITITRSVSLYIGINSDSLSNIIITAKGQHKTHTRCKIQSLRVKVKPFFLCCLVFFSE